MDDLLSELLSPLRLGGVFHSRWIARAPWAVAGEREDCAILHYVQDGECVAELGDDVIHLRAGDLAVFPHGAGHRLGDRPGRTATPLSRLLADRPLGAVRTVEIDGYGPATVMLCGGLHYDPQSAAPLYRALPQVIVLDRPAVERQPFLASTLRRLAEEWTAEEAGAPLVTLRAFELVFVLALRAALTELPAPVLRAMRHPAIGKALLAIHTRFAEPWTLESLAAEAGLSRSAFAAAFRDLVGEPPMRHLTARRMQEAARLLADTTLPHGRIAERVGYGSAVGFHLAFRAWSGRTPGEFRRGAA
ncbi:AraC family transcriptional regulator [Thermoactinospora rubra]|uniref:AraC family transcriptional regulator n=1 Tax=Thermoactinospora rubra TaxID=1088767 RepID=UPI000A10D2D6|nr:AraC family transcriptional regulator [Thermoactinospora rubra]